MLRSILTHLLLPCSPAILATALGWPAFGTPGRVALLTMIAASVIFGLWQLLSARRRASALLTLTMQVEDLANSEDPIDSELISELCDELGGELQELTEQLQCYLGNVADAATAQRDLAASATATPPAAPAPAHDAEQTAALLSISAALEQMAANVSETVRRAGDASELASKAESSASNGTTAMQRMVEAMAEIDASSSEISRIIRVIDDIAFQTNLLALNAAVEAARAGDAGRGFAVVAEEVRNLAQRSAEAARNTSSLIAVASQRAQRGSQISQEVDGMLAEIVDATTRFSKLVAQIATSTKQQSAGIQQVTRSVDELQTADRPRSAPVSFGSAFDETFIA